MKANTDELIRRGGFGSPNLFVDGEDRYFGNERLPLLRGGRTAATCTVPGNPLPWVVSGRYVF